MTGWTLRNLRVLVSAAVLLLLTAALTGCAWFSGSVAHWLVDIQIFPAVMSFSIVVFVVWLLVTLMFGRVYCSTVCPLGTLQDMASAITRVIARHRGRLQPYRYTAPTTLLQRIMLLLTIMLLMVGVVYVASLLDPFTVYSDFVTRCADPAMNGLFPLLALKTAVVSLAGTVVSFLLFLLVAVLAASNGRVVCNTVCPVGTTLGFVSRYAIWQVGIDTDLCTHCGACEAVCKAHCINLKDNVVDGARCVNCFTCLGVCPNKAIQYSARRKQLSDLLMQPTDDPHTSASSSINEQ